MQYSCTNNPIKEQKMNVFQIILIIEIVIALSIFVVYTIVKERIEWIDKFKLNDTHIIRMKLSRSESYEIDEEIVFDNLIATNMEILKPI